MPVRRTPGRARFSDAALRAAPPLAVPPRGPRQDTEAADAEAGDAETRPLSLWPASTRPAELNSQSFPASHFDPRLEQKAAERARAGAALEVCSGLTALRLVLGVQLALALGVLVASGQPREWLAQQSAAMYVGLAGCMFWLVAVCACRRVLARFSAPRRLAALLGLGAACALVAWAPLQWIGLAAAGGGLQPLGVGLAGAAFAAAAWTWLDLRARLWQPVDASVRLAELQSRIRPHFLFNALNTALALVRVDPARAEGVLEDLAQLFRVALADAGASVSLDEELDLARRYLAIEQIRYGERLQVSWDVDARVGRARLPPLVLQPLVENAVRHGIEPAVQGGRIWVQAGVRRGQAVVLVSNTVPDVPSRPGHGMALHNVRERLRLLHDVAGQFDTWREGGLFRARIIVPL